MPFRGMDYALFEPLTDIHNEALTDELVGYAAVTASPVSYHTPVVAVFDL